MSFIKEANRCKGAFIGEHDPHLRPAGLVRAIRSQDGEIWEGMMDPNGAR